MGSIILWQDASVRERPSLAGGCFLTAAIIVGYFVGLSIGNPMQGVLGGTILGVGAALALWLVDRRGRD